MRGDFSRNVGYVRAVMVNRMTYRDRVYFGTQQTVSDDIHATYGVRLCTRTVRRIQNHLANTGEWKRDPDFRIKGKKLRTTAWRCRHGVLRKPKCPTTETSFPKNTKTYNTYGVGAGSRRRNYGRRQRWRRAMGEVVRIDGAVPANATPGQALFTAVVDELAVAGVTLPRSVIATAVSHGKTALADGVEPEVVLLGCLAALRQGKGRYAHEIIADMALAKAGRQMTPQEYRHFLALENRKNNPDTAAVRNAMDSFNRKQITGGSDD